MPSNTISGTYASYALTVDSTTLTNLGTIGSTSVTAGLIVSGSQDTVVNAGSITGLDNAVTASMGLSLTNQSSGTISSFIAVRIDGAPGTVSNAGHILAGSAGVSLAAGGAVTNQSGGTLSASFGSAVRVTGAAGTVVNAGVLNGDSYGVLLLAGGAVTNQTSGLISNFLSGGVVVRGSSGTVDNAGGITSAVYDGVRLASGGSVINRAGATIAGSATAGHAGVTITGGTGTVTNAGSIAGNTAGILLSGGGLVTNQAGGTISAASLNAVRIENAIGTVVNAGALMGGTYGVALDGGGSVTNQSGGTITATLASGDAGVEVRSAVGTVDNAGLIAGRRDGVYLLDGGTVINRAGGMITGQTRDGVQVGAAAGTVINAGTISGPLAAVLFNAGYANRLVFDPGAVFTGTVDGGNTIGAPVVSTLELASAASAGTLNGLGTQFIDFANVTVDSGATWSIANAIGTGVTLINAGTLATQVTLSAGAVLTNVSGGRVALTAAAVRGTGAGTVVNAGSLSGTSYGVTLAAGGMVTNQSGGTISGGARGVTAEGTTATLINAGMVSGNDVGVVLNAGGAVVNQGGGTIANGFNRAVVIQTGAGTVINAGRIAGYYEGVLFTASGQVTNQSGGTITSTFRQGVRIDGTVGTVVNAGVINGYDNGVLLRITQDGATVSNQSGGTISQTASPNFPSAGAVAILNVRGSVDNAGLITGVQRGIRLDAGGSVTNQSTGTIAGSYAIHVRTAAGTVVNAGAITGTQEGILLTAGGGVTNQSAGTIRATAATGRGVEFSVVSGTVDNAGSIAGGVVGIFLNAGGEVTNRAGGTISQSGGTFAYTNYTGLLVTGGSATVTNAGVITGEYNGVFLSAGGVVTNLSGGTISSPLGSGAVIRNGTLVNAGTISGAAYAVQFSSLSGNNRLIVDPGAVFSGKVDGGATATTFASTLELASGASIGTLSGIGSQYLNFTSVVVDVGATWVLTGTNSFASAVTLTDAGTLTAASLIGAGAATIEAGAILEVQGTISGGESINFDTAGGRLILDAPGSVAGSVTGFEAGDAIDLVGVDPTSVSFSGGQLHFTSGGTPHAFALSATGPVSAVSDGHGGAEVTALCFCAGTLILTPRGEVAVETLSEGDLVITQGGAARPLIWIGTGRVMVPRGRRSGATPVIVRKGALADNVPNRDLRVTKGHSLLLDAVLIPVEFLVNHRSIQWDDQAREVQIFHLELARHDVLVANGAPAESYRDDGNRWLFQNANTGWDQPPKPPCAPVLTGGPIVDAVWRRLLDRSGPLPDLKVTEDPDLHLLVDGQRVDRARSRNGCITFALPRNATDVRIVSRAAAPAELGLARDPRILGVAIRQIRLWRGPQLRMLNSDHETLNQGFHEYETDNGFRWTDGDARLPESLFSGMVGQCELDLLVASTARYPLARISQCAPTARFTSGGRIHPGSCR